MLDGGLLIKGAAIMTGSLGLYIAGQMIESNPQAINEVTKALEDKGVPQDKINTAIADALQSIVDEDVAKLDPELQKHFQGLKTSEESMKFLSEHCPNTFNKVQDGKEILARIEEAKLPPEKKQQNLFQRTVAALTNTMNNMVKDVKAMKDTVFTPASTQGVEGGRKPQEART